MSSFHWSSSTWHSHSSMTRIILCILIDCAVVFYFNSSSCCEAFITLLTTLNILLWIYPSFLFYILYSICLYLIHTYLIHYMDCAQVVHHLKFISGRDISIISYTVHLYFALWFSSRVFINCSSASLFIFYIILSMFKYVGIMYTL